MYLVLGNLLYIFVCLGIVFMLMEGVDVDFIGELFSKELDGYICEVVVVMGYLD